MRPKADRQACKSQALQEVLFCWRTYVAACKEACDDELDRQRRRPQRVAHWRKKGVEGVDALIPSIIDTKIKNWARPLLRAHNLILVIVESSDLAFTEAVVKRVRLSSLFYRRRVEQDYHEDPTKDAGRLPALEDPALEEHDNWMQEVTDRVVTEGDRQPLFKRLYPVRNALVETFAQIETHAPLYVWGINGHKTQPANRLAKSDLTDYAQIRGGYVPLFDHKTTDDEGLDSYMWQAEIRTWSNTVG